MLPVGVRFILLELISKGGRLIYNNALLFIGFAVMFPC